MNQQIVVCISDSATSFHRINHPCFVGKQQLNPEYFRTSNKTFGRLEREKVGTSHPQLQCKISVCIMHFVAVAGALAESNLNNRSYHQSGPQLGFQGESNLL